MRSSRCAAPGPGFGFLVDEVQYRGHARGHFMDFEFGPEGKPVDFRLLHVCEFRGERISREQVWVDVDASAAKRAESICVQASHAP